MRLSCFLLWLLFIYDFFPAPVIHFLIGFYLCFMPKYEFKGWRWNILLIKESCFLRDGKFYVLLKTKTLTIDICIYILNGFIAAKIKSKP